MRPYNEILHARRIGPVAPLVLIPSAAPRHRNAIESRVRFLTSRVKPLLGSKLYRPGLVHIGSCGSTTAVGVDNAGGIGSRTKVFDHHSLFVQWLRPGRRKVGRGSAQCFYHDSPVAAIKTGDAVGPQFDNDRWRSGYQFGFDVVASPTISDGNGIRPWCQVCDGRCGCRCCPTPLKSIRRTAS